MIVFGKCPVTGRRGDDGDTVSDPQDGNGYELIKFRGEYMHSLTKEELIDDETDIRETEKHSNTTSFLRSIGINKA
jgi:hypothetical protein